MANFPCRDCKARTPHRVIKGREAPEDGRTPGVLRIRRCDYCDLTCETFEQQLPPGWKKSPDYQPRPIRRYGWKKAKRLREEASASEPGGSSDANSEPRASSTDGDGHGDDPARR